MSRRGALVSLLALAGCTQLQQLDAGPDADRGMFDGGPGTARDVSLPSLDGQLDATPDAPIASCGNGRVEGDETCDDGNRDEESACAYGVATCTACSADCFTALVLSGPVCGDGDIDGPETCDDGNRDEESACAYGVATCTACSADCATALALSGPICGDGEINGPEVCDDGNTADEVACPYGMRTCAGCAATCAAALSLVGPFCGDRMINGPEGCELGQTQCRVNPVLCGVLETRTCGSTCQWGSWTSGGCGTCP